MGCLDTMFMSRTGQHVQMAQDVILRQGGFPKAHPCSPDCVLWSACPYHNTQKGFTHVFSGLPAVTVRVSALLHGLNRVPPASPNYIQVGRPSASECDLIWRDGLCGGNHVIVRVGPSPTGLGVLMRRGNWDTGLWTEGRYVRTQGGDDHLQAKKRSLEEVLPSQCAQETNPVGTLLRLLAPRTV